MKVVKEAFHQLLQKVWCLWDKHIFVHIDEDFAINYVRPKFLSKKDDKDQETIQLSTTPDPGYPMGR